MAAMKTGPVYSRGRSISGALELLGTNRPQTSLSALYNIYHLVPPTQDHSNPRSKLLKRREEGSIITGGSPMVISSFDMDNLKSRYIS